LSSFLEERRSHESLKKRGRAKYDGDRRREGRGGKKETQRKHKSYSEKTEKVVAAKKGTVKAQEKTKALTEKTSRDEKR